jgi:hypothetical protein
MKKYKPTKWWESASTWLQFLVTAQSFVVLFLVLVNLSAPPLPTAIWCSLVFVAWSGYREWALLKSLRVVEPRI